MLRSVSIIIPVYNEGSFIFRSTRKLINNLRANHFANFEIILVENGSTDTTAEYCQQLVHKFPKIVFLYRLPFPSYGQALRTGILAAKNEHLVIFNTDFWDINFLKKAKELMPPAEIVVGSKTLVTSRDKRPRIRRLTTYFFNNLLKLVLNFQGTDTHGIKVINRELAVRLVKKCRSLNELMDTELILRACWENCRYFELPITVREVRPSRYNNWRRVYNTLTDMAVVFRTKLYDLSHQR